MGDKKTNISFDPARLDLILKEKNIISIKQRTDFLKACGCSYANYKAWKRRKSISESDLTAILSRLGVTADQLCVVNYKEAMNEYKDWIVRFYASHKDIPKGHSDCETLKELVRCKDCKHRPKRTGDEGNGFDYEFPDYKCPCRCDDGWYNWMPEDDWYCGNGERKEE